MATLIASSKMSGSYGSHYTLRLYGNEDSYSTSGNTSSCTFTLKLYFDGSSYYAYTNYTTSGSITANGSTTSGSISSISFSSGTSKEITLMSCTRTVSHDSDGSKTVSASGTWNTDTSRMGSGSCSGTLKLTTIPRKSSVSASSANLGATSTIKITRASSSFTHTLTYSFAGTSTRTGTIATRTSSTSVSWTVPTDFYQYMASKTSGTVTITCETFTGSTSLGTSTCTMTASVVKDDCTPSLGDGDVVDTNPTSIALTGDDKVLLIGRSTAKLTATATLRNYATLSSITINGTKSTDYTSSTTDGTTTINLDTSFTNCSTAEFVIKVTDSRNYDTSITVSTDSQEYVNLTCNATAVRPSPTSDEIDIKTCTGNYHNGDFGTGLGVENYLYMYWEWFEGDTIPEDGLKTSSLSSTKRMFYKYGQPTYNIYSNKPKVLKKVVGVSTFEELEEACNGNTGGVICLEDDIYFPHYIIIENTPDGLEIDMNGHGFYFSDDCEAGNDAFFWIKDGGYLTLMASEGECTVSSRDYISDGRDLWIDGGTLIIDTRDEDSYIRFTTNSDRKSISLGIGTLKINTNAYTVSSASRFISYNEDSTTITTEIIGDVEWTIYTATGISPTTLDLSGFTTNYVSDTTSMFEDCTATELDLSGFLFNNTTEYENMFAGCIYLETVYVQDEESKEFIDERLKEAGLDITSTIGGAGPSNEKWDATNLETTNYMFYEYPYSLDLEGFNPTGSTSMVQMFYGYGSSTLDASSIEATNVTNMTSMFENCTNLSTLDLGRMNFENVTDYEDMFKNCTNLKNVYVKDEEAKEFIDARLEDAGLDIESIIQPRGGILAYYYTDDEGTHRYNVNLDGNTYSVNATNLGTTFDYKTVYTIRITVVDYLSKVNVILTVTQGIPIFNWGEDFFNVNAEKVLYQGTPCYTTAYTTLEAGTTMQDGLELKLPIEYYVGTGTLELYWDGMLLQCKDGNDDGNYVEVGEDLSDTIAFYRTEDDGTWDIGHDVIIMERIRI